MIEVCVKSRWVQQDLFLIKCRSCRNTVVFSKKDLAQSGYNRCESCGHLLPDMESLVYDINSRIVHHIRHSEHFVKRRQQNV